MEKKDCIASDKMGLRPGEYDPNDVVREMEIEEVEDPFPNMVMEQLKKQGKKR